MIKRYKSKIGLELVIPLTLIFGTTLFLQLIVEQNLLAIAIVVLIIILIVHMFVTTHYTINGDILEIKCGFTFKETVDIKTIKSISETNTILSAPATSIDRIEIQYGKFDSVVISPKQKLEFINDIVAINPAVVLHFKIK
ncbi:PH domain-containing protein [Flavobacterium weaverense]|uniref:PH (Pleckstrin Homology) domain-containing protein n=1 Tax=Flavobacterium weaverense TaxID=271156 RepID=A0A3L9ZI74_9FLAO|nr:PH domain-containing protein [Flavobacterium weaverense]RMA71667.1 PH (Pleckstrin Homology) domain-containing protein [Flavobacterium weaverense]